MNSLIRFFARGAADADARVARALAPRPLAEANRYLHDSRAAQFLDSATLLLESWWHASAIARAANEQAGEWHRQHPASRYAALGAAMLIAVATHLVLMVLQGPHPGWYWLLLPAIAAVFGALLLAASRSVNSTR